MQDRVTGIRQSKALETPGISCTKVTNKFLFQNISQRFNKWTYYKMEVLGCSIPIPTPTYVFKTSLCFTDFSGQKFAVSPPTAEPFRHKFSISVSKVAVTTPQITFCHSFLSQIPTGFQESYGEYSSLNLFPHSTQLTTFVKLNVLLQKLNLLKITLFIFPLLPSLPCQVRNAILSPNSEEI